jgi:hypothetical protein
MPVGVAETASTAELLWLGIGLVAGAVNTVLWIIAVRDLRAVYAMRQNGAKRIEAWTWFWAHLALVLTQAIAVGIGVFAVLSLPANPGRPNTTVGLVIVSGLIAKQVLNCTLGIFLILRRGKLDAYIDGRERTAVLIPVERVTVQEAVDIVAAQQDEAAARVEGGIPDGLDEAEIARRRAQADAKQGGHDD